MPGGAGMEGVDHYIPSGEYYFQMITQTIRGIGVGLSKIIGEGEDIDDEKKALIEKEFGSVDAFLDEFFKSEVRSEFFFRSLVKLEARTVPHLYYLYGQYPHYELSRVEWNLWVDAFESFEFSKQPDRTAPALEQGWQLAQTLAERSRQRLQVIQRFSSKSIDLTDVSSRALERFPKENVEAVTKPKIANPDAPVLVFSGSVESAILKAYKAITTAEAAYKDYRQSSPSELITFLYRESWELEAPLEKFERILLKDDEDGKKALKDFRDGLANSRDWLESMISVASLKDDEKKKLKNSDENYQHRFYFDLAKLKSEEVLLSEGIKAPQWISKVTKKVSIQGTKNASMELSAIESLFPWTSEEPMSISEADIRRSLRYFSRWSWMRNAHWELGSVTNEDRAEILVGENELQKSIDGFLTRYKSRFSDPQSEYLKSLYARIDLKVNGFVNEVLASGQHEALTRFFLEKETLLREELRQRRFQAASILIKTMADRLKTAEAEGHMTREVLVVVEMARNKLKAYEEILSANNNLAQLSTLNLETLSYLRRLRDLKISIPFDLSLGESVIRSSLLLGAPSFEMTLLTEEIHRRSQQILEAAALKKLGRP